MIKTITKLAGITPCAESRSWLASCATIDEVWATCPRGEWLLWLAGHIGADHKTIVLAACDCAETALQFVPDGEDRPRIAIETARAWCLGDATIGEVCAAAVASCTSTHSASTTAAAAAAAAAAYAADDAYHAAHSAADATAAAAAAADTYAAYAADVIAARAENARLVRLRFPTLPTTANGGTQ